MKSVIFVLIALVGLSANAQKAYPSALDRCRETLKKAVWTYAGAQRHVDTWSVEREIRNLVTQGTIKENPNGSSTLHVTIATTAYVWAKYVVRMNSTCTFNNGDILLIDKGQGNGRL